MSQSASGSLEKRSHAVVKFEVNVKGLWVKRVSLGTDESLSMAVLGVHAKDEDDAEIRIEDVWSLVKKGQQVKITARPSQGSSVVVFHGWIQMANIGVGGKTEDLEYTALGLDWALKTEKVWGAWCKEGNGDGAVWLRGIPPVFNRDGKPNKSTKECNDSDGNKRLVFELDDSDDNPDSEHWSAAQMVRYLIGCERKSEMSSTEGDVFEKTYQPGGEIANLKPYNVAPEDEDVWSAIVNVAHRCSHGVRIRYQDDRTKSELHFFTRAIDDASTKKQLEVPEANLDVVALEDPMKTAAALDVQFDLSGIVRRVDVVAPPKLFDTNFELLQGWNLEDEEAAFGSSGAAATRIASFLRETDPQTSSDWERFKWVGRRYILNETGRDACTTPDVGPWNFDTVFGSSEWSRRNRPFKHNRVAKKEGEEEEAPLPITIHVAFGGGMPDDIQLGRNVVILPDRAGIYFAGAPCVNVARALESGDHTDILPTTVTIDAMLEGDQDSPHDVYAVLDGSEQPVPTFGLVRLDEGFRQSNLDTGTEAEDEARKLADETMDTVSDGRIVGTAVIPWISFAFEPGDVIDNINGRDLKVKALVAKVSHDVEQQATELAFEFASIDTGAHSRQTRATAPVGPHIGRQAQGMAFVADLLALQALGHPVEEALKAAVGGESKAEVDRLLRKVLPGGERWDDPTE